MRLLLALCLLLAATGLAQEMSPRDVVKGGYVLYFRHGEADIGEDCRNPKIRRWWRSRSPEKTRQLTEHGKLQSRTIGRAFHKLGIQVDGVWCSEFTRAKDTAEEQAATANAARPPNAPPSTRPCRAPPPTSSSTP